MNRARRPGESLIIVEHHVKACGKDCAAIRDLLVGHDFLAVMKAGGRRVFSLSVKESMQHVTGRRT